MPAVPAPSSALAARAAPRDPAGGPGSVPAASGSPPPAPVPAPVSPLLRPTDDEVDPPPRPLPAGAVRGPWGEARGRFPGSRARAALAEAAWDRERGRQRHNATALQRRRHLVGPLPDRYVTTRDAASQAATRFFCLLCHAFARPYAEEPFLSAECPSVGIPTAERLCSRALRNHRERLALLAARVESEGGRTWPPPEPPP